MLAELKGAALLDRARGEAPIDKEALIDIIMRVGGADGLMMQTAGQVSEIDLNPIIASTKGAVAADARFILAKVQADATLAAAKQPMSALERFRPLFEPKTVAVLAL